MLPTPWSRDGDATSVVDRYSTPLRDGELMPLQVADKNISIADAVARLAHYPCKTLKQYDGHSPGPRRHWRQYTDDDIDAARIIERRAIRDDVAERILSAELPWDRVPSRNLDIEDVSPDSRAYDQLARFYLALTALHGVGRPSPRR